MENTPPRHNERDFYKEIARRAKRVRERAAESLRRSREARKADPGTRRRKFRPR